MANKYYYIAITPIIIFIIGLMINIEIQLFIANVLAALIGNFFIAWIFFFLYKANKQDALVSDNKGGKYG